MEGVLRGPFQIRMHMVSPAIVPTGDTKAVAPAVPQPPEPAGNGATSLSNSTTSSKDSKDELCPACPKEGRAGKKNAKTTHWVECENCSTWYHWDCVSKGEPLGNVDKWYCDKCIAGDSSLAITYKAAPRKSQRKRTQLNGDPSADPLRWMKVVESKRISADRFKRMKGEDVDVRWLNEDPTAFMEPVVVEDPLGLGMKMPGWLAEDLPPTDGSEVLFDVRDVAAIVGGDTPVEVMDVATQSASPGWTMSKWAEYYHSPPEARDKIRNVISLEITDTPLAEQVQAPRLVRQIDWFHQFWPANRKAKGQFPKVQFYCLMSVSNCWTDMHVDFAGSSVFYHVVKGAKVFYFIRPTKANLTAYEKWCMSENQASTWLGDMVDEVIKVEVQRGQTMFIPTGWIHAVFTPEDSLVIGGNFLHSYNITTELRVRDIEIKTRVPKKFRFPLFQKMCWYVGEGYNRILRKQDVVPPRVLSEVRSLSDFLMSEARLLEGSGAASSDTSRKEAKDMVPSDKVPDPSALARELRWRLRLLMDGDSGDEGLAKPKAGPSHVNGHLGSRSKRSTPSTLGNKRKREASEERAPSVESTTRKIFRNYTPRAWDGIKKTEGVVQRRSGDALPEEWSVAVIGGRGDLETQTDRVVKVRHTEDEHGNKTIVERQTIIRTKEVWRRATDEGKMELGA